MSDLHAAQLFDEASAAGLRITGLDGWTQTRLAGSLKLRRLVLGRKEIKWDTLIRPGKAATLKLR